MTREELIALEPWECQQHALDLRDLCLSVMEERDALREELARTALHRTIPDMPIMTEEEQYKARLQLAMSHDDGVCHIYGDDGEIQCNNLQRHGRCLDFRREQYSVLLDEVRLCKLKESAEKMRHQMPELAYLDQKRHKKGEG